MNGRFLRDLTPRGCASRPMTVAGHVMATGSAAATRDGLMVRRARRDVEVMDRLAVGSIASLLDTEMADSANQGVEGKS